MAPRFRALVLISALLAPGCTDDAGPTGPTGPSEDLLLIQGEMSRTSQSIRLTFGGEPVDGATVTVNGEAAVQAAPGDPYVVVLAPQVAVGDPVTLSVSVGPIVYGATGTVPPTPVITGIGGGYGTGERVWVSWSMAANPDRFGVSAVRCWQNLPPTYSRTDIAGSKREFTFPVSLPSEHFLYVSAYSNGTFTGPVHRSSRMSIQGTRDMEILGYC